MDELRIILAAIAAAVGAGVGAGAPAHVVDTEAIAVTIPPVVIEAPASSVIDIPVTEGDWVGIDGTGWAVDSLITTDEAMDGTANHPCLAPGPYVVTVWHPDGTTTVFDGVCP